MLNIPTSIVAGDSVAWRDSHILGIDPLSGQPTEFDPSVYTLTWAFRGASALDVTAVEDRGEFLTTIAPSQSELLTPGVYAFGAFLTGFGNRICVGSGLITVGPNLVSAAAGFDGRTDTQKMLDAVNAAIRAIADGGAVESYEIKGRNLKRMPLSELIQLRDRLKAEVWRERAAGQIALGLGDPRRVFVRWGPG